MPEWTRVYQGFENCHIAVMGCIVNGIGEARNADIGIFIPGDYEKPQLQIYVQGQHLMNLEGTNIIEVGRTFMKEIESYFESRFQKK
jgi:4-hydroxy-3-methylbut-2-en-1-yl diphosphate synthase IspG/GcpE